MMVPYKYIHILYYLLREQGPLTILKDLPHPNPVFVFHVLEFFLPHPVLVFHVINEKILPPLFAYFSCSLNRYYRVLNGH